MEKTNTDLTAETITPAQIAALREEALLAGDTEQVTLCDLAAGTRGVAHPADWRHGWHLAGVGPARFGWATYSSAGRCTWLGATLRQAARQQCVVAIAAARTQEERS